MMLTICQLFDFSLTALGTLQCFYAEPTATHRCPSDQCLFGSHFIVQIEMSTMAPVCIVGSSEVKDLCMGMCRWSPAGKCQSNLVCLWEFPCQYYSVGNGPFTPAQHFDLEFHQGTDVSRCSRVLMTLLTLGVPTLRREHLGVPLGQEAWLRIFSMEKPQAAWGSQTWCPCFQPESPLAGTKVCLLWPWI